MQDLSTVKVYFISFIVYGDTRLSAYYCCLGFCNRGVKRKVLKCFLMPYYIHLMNKYSIDLPLTLKLGGGCQMPHGGPIVINGSAIIGKNMTIHPGVLVGGQRGKGVPVIGDNCFLGNGAKIIGNVKIGDWCFVCPNTVVVKDQIPKSVISGVPSKVLNMEGEKNCKLYLV